jgi:uncharacterized protein
MSANDFINLTADYVKNELKNAEAGHNWWHIERVRRNAVKIAQEENVDMQVVELAALLHDIADSKFNDGDESIGPQKARAFLQSIGVEEMTIDHIVKIIENISFKGGHKSSDFSSAELDVVQDADRLDAIGAIGIARAFHYGGFKNRELYDPAIKPNLNMTKEEYKNTTAPTINHFYEKLLLLKDKMNTTTGTQLAQDRHDFMVVYLDQFLHEFHG